MTELHPKTFRDYLGGVKFTSLQEGLTEDGWNLADAATQQLLAKLKATGRPLGEYVNGEIYYGIKTGYNKAFVIDAETRDRLIAEDPASAEIIKPFLAGRDVKRYTALVATDYLIFTRRGVNINAYPAIKGYLAEYREQLEPKPKDWPRNKKWPGRKSGPYQWYEIQDSVNYYESFEQTKIIYAEIAQVGQFTLDRNYLYGDTTVYILPIDDLGTLGYLNSTLFLFQFSAVSSSVRGGFLRWKRQYMEMTSLPRTSLEVLAPLVQKILDQKQADPSVDTSSLEEKIDLIVYKLYELSYAEVLIVDTDFSLSEEAYSKTLM